MVGTAHVIRTEVGQLRFEGVTILQPAPIEEPGGAAAEAVQGVRKLPSLTLLGQRT